MTNPKFIKFSLIISLVGIICIIFLSIYAEPRLSSIDQINKKQLDNYVKISGAIINIENIKSENYSFYIIRLKDNSSSIDLIYNKNNNLKLNQKIQVIGKVSEYKNELQIEASKIKVL